MTDSKLDAACRWLRKYLRGGPKLCGNRFNPKPGTVYGDGIQVGHAGMTIRRAADAINVCKEKVNRRWYWSLPERCRPPKPAAPQEIPPAREPRRRLKKVVVTYIFE